jgi:transcription initiation factor TFIID TATA-box-binding protein
MSNQHVNTFSIKTHLNDYPLSNSTQAVPVNISQSNNNKPTPLINISSENTAKITVYNYDSINNNHETINLLKDDNNHDKASALKSTKHETYPLVNECNIKINNIVALVNSGCKLNLKHIGLICKNTEYNPKRFNALIMRSVKPKAVALIFDSGKIIVTGATTEEDSRAAARKIIKILRNCGFKVGYKSFKIINIVSSCDVNFPIRLRQLNYDLRYKYNIKGNKVYYEPEVFPGLIYRMEKPKVTVLMFASGKINFVGAKKQEDIFEAYKKIYPIVVKYENKEIKKEINNDNKDENSNNYNNFNIFNNDNNNNFE